MSKTIKVIDLLNKIANGEEVPKKIKILGIEFEWFEECYRTCKIEREYLTDYCRLDNMLNDTVEIIEEEPEIDIQEIKETEICKEGKMKYYEYHNNGETKSKVSRNYSYDSIETREIINKLIKSIKQLDKQIKEK